MAGLMESPPQAVSARDDVSIPDFVLIKRIGSGAYGEVWLAQSVTGSLRAVKIVWREDFEFIKTFHREFEGIQQFEPISRGHPGLVHILHVGWNEERGYYYYVMELADDAVTGPHLPEPAAYQPRTLSSDMRQHGRLDLHFCQEAGAFLADALHYMHEHGLTHRDVKPSNIIYCGGVCKLADIGLVAVSGERSFVGTEGFVPPEGPGTPQADLYSLGKVIYEMSSGKDRMEFPEVPDDLEVAEWPFWKNLNRIICRACSPDLQERFATCAAFAEALRKVDDLAPVTVVQRVTRTLGRVALLIFLAFIGGGAWAAWKHQQEWTYSIPLPRKPPPPSRLPEQDKPWQSVMGLEFWYRKDRHIADQPVDIALFSRFLDATMRPFEGDVVPTQMPNKKIVNAVAVPPEDANDFCVWMTERDRKGGRLTEDREYAWKPFVSGGKGAAGGTPAKNSRVTILCEIVPVIFGRLVVLSTPSPAQVYVDDRLIGPTPLSHELRVGPVEIEVRYPGYKTETQRGVIQAGKPTSFNLKLKNINAVIYGKAWTNTLRMKVVPLGNVLISATEVRRRDFREFVRERKLPVVPERQLDIENELEFPVTFVSRAEAEAFCDWLTEKEQSAEMIEGQHRYRLPTDDEWSMAANLPREKGDSPAERHLHVGGIYPWGFTWPPVPKPGNLFDEAAAKRAGQEGKGIAGYSDGYDKLSPVGAFRPDWRGIMDLAGNVWEWVKDDYGGADPASATLGTCRGGGWDTAEREQLLASYRRPVPADARLPNVGFRVILSDGRPAREDE